MRAWTALSLGCLVAGSARPAASQQVEPGSLPLTALCPTFVTAGSANEETLLLASLTSPVAHSSAVRPMLTVDAKEIAAANGGEPGERCDTRWVRPRAQVWYNTSAAHAARDGGVWQGRGATASLTAGIVLQRGVFAVALRPMAHFAENKAFSPSVSGQGPGRFRDPVYGAKIDLPYRLGAGVRAQLDPGESFAKVQWRRASLGFTTQSQQWGPAHFYPLILSVEGAGFPRAFAELQNARTPLADVTAQWQMGLLEASPFTELEPGGRSRVSSAFIASIAPRGLSALHVGATRFFHVRREPGSVSLATATLPFSGLLKNQSSDAAVGGFNQLASIFFRVAPSGAGAEAYGELYRDDHNADLRDLVGEPDHASAYVVGVRRVWRGDSSFRALTIERGNGRISHLTRLRPQTAPYTHEPIVEGHTFRGQPLGSDAILGGGGTAISWQAVERSRSLDILLEIRTQAQNAEGGTSDGTPTGEYVLEVGMRRSASGHTTRRSIGVQQGYGRHSRTNFTISFSRSF